MKGDFSRWDIDENKKENFNGVLHQQGRVLLDNDWNAAARITNAWQDQNGRDVIGPGVAAVPAEVPDSFKVQGASVETSDNTEQVVLEIKPGRVWADGLLTYLPGEEPDTKAAIEREATYLEPPIQDVVTSSSITRDIRDAVILEVWREAVNGFQMKDKLIEPALGGPDTTERVHTAMAFRLLRLKRWENCENIRARLKDDPAKMGTLKVSLQPSQTINGECPVEQGGGYTGFEHHLYRIEIAQVDREEKMFKWSRFNGGLVGRGKFESGKVNITDNFQAITTSGLTSFYLEAVEYNESLGHWEVTYAAEVILNSDNQLDLDSTFFGGVPSAGEPVFFRLWDGIKQIDKFPSSDSNATTPTEPEELENGIRLEFDTESNKFYRPGDYWTFEVRAGEITNKEILIGKKKNDGTIIGVPPEGILYHRVPLAILTWKNNREIGQIDDCRVIFHPLTKLKGCCTVTVGPGGDFDKIQNAVDYLDNTYGGLICILPGVYDENVTIAGKRNIIIKGCVNRTLVRPSKRNAAQPIFHIINSQGITLEDMDMETYGGIAILMDKTNNDINRKGILEQIEISNNRILALKNAVRVEDGARIKIIGNIIRMIDKDGGEVAIFMLAEESVIERNDITVVPPENFIHPVRPGSERYPNPADPCVDLEALYLVPSLMFGYGILVWNFKLSAYPQKGFNTPGGIQIASNSEDIKILHNRVKGGFGNGITLGHTPKELDEELRPDLRRYAVAFLPIRVLERLQPKFDSFINHLDIEENEIRNMGLNGIGMVCFFNIKSIGLIVSLEDMTIYRNIIMDCLQQVPGEINAEMTKEMSFGGISLADCEKLAARENRIENNGVNYAGPVCGIFIQHGEKIDISDNRILNNGPKTMEHRGAVRTGMGGGIVIRWGFIQMKMELMEFLENKQIPFRDGIPAVKIHDNIITQPLGQALLVMALGPVSVVGNHLTSQGVDSRSNPFSMVAGSVLIFNLGVSADLYAWTVVAKIGTIIQAQPNPALRQSTVSRGVRYQTLPYLPSGNVLFNSNQTTLDLWDEKIDNPKSSQWIFSLDDVSYVGNQSQCTALGDLLLADALIAAATVRTNDNRFQEGFTATWFSLISVGLLMNTCSTNQASHCLVPVSIVKPKETLKIPNNTVMYGVLYNPFSDVLTCSNLKKMITGFITTGEWKALGNND